MKVKETQQITISHWYRWMPLYSPIYQLQSNVSIWAITDIDLIKRWIPGAADAADALILSLWFYELH